MLHTALISNAFLNQNKDKREQFSLKSVRSKGTKWKIQYLLRLKTQLVRFVFGSKGSDVIMGHGEGELRGL